LGVAVLIAIPSKAQMKDSTLQTANRNSCAWGVRQTGEKHFRMTNYQVTEFILKIIVSSSSKMFAI